MKARHKRLTLILAGLALLGGAVALILSAFQENLVFFHTPTEVAEGKAPSGRSFRIGGLVETGSIKRAADGVTVNFVVTDTARSIPVSYKGPLPDLFKEGKGAVESGVEARDLRHAGRERDHRSDRRDLVGLVQR